MFGLAIIAASLNLMVLKFMTLNTEDEKRDEQQAIQVRIQHKHTKLRHFTKKLKFQNYSIKWSIYLLGLQTIYNFLTYLCPPQKAIATEMKK